jgi:NADPH-dependent glutamate synthase beta subunit-like oxidoreductase/glutamate synthase domain-containing protein 3/Pyruvate/2-oxoacid:ferredoxin oxidoreductase delta subunit
VTTQVVKGRDENGQRISSMDFEKMVRQAVSESPRVILESYGQHNIGLRLQRDDGLQLEIKGPCGQRLGTMGMPGTTIVCDGAVSDDVGYLNIGAEITVLGDATNGACNAMAAGKVFIKGSIGARGLTMTKWNPDYSKPELWVLGSTGDSFAEFNCGGVAVVCGINPKSPDNIVGYRPCVGMVGGLIYFRGKDDGSFSKTNARLALPDDQQWQWLVDNMPDYLEKIGQSDLLERLTIREEWQILTTVTPQERALMWSGPMPMAEYREQVWNKAFGGGDPLRDLSPELDRSPIGTIVTGELRRRSPWWANSEAAAPCTYYCPIHIPTVDRLRLIREGKLDEAYELVLGYTPLPASVCGAVCPNLCMENCTRTGVDGSIEMQILGRAVANFAAPAVAEPLGKKVAIIGGGPAGIASAWQLAIGGVEAHIFEKDSQIGGKLAQVVPWERLPQAIWDEEIKRFLSMPNIHVHYETDMDTGKFQELRDEFDYVIIAVGTHQPRRLTFPGHEHVIPALDFLKEAKGIDSMNLGQEVVVIGAGNVGCDVACEAYRLGATKVTLVDIQKPLAFGKEKEAAEAFGAQFRWPVFTKEVTSEGLITDSGDLIPAQTVFISIGDVPSLPFLGDSVQTLEVGGSSWIKTDRGHKTSDAKVLAIGDVEKPGLATDALGAGKNAAECILAEIKGENWQPFSKQLIPQQALTISHYNPDAKGTTEEDQAGRCLSCATCRDCHLCETMCPTGAITRNEFTFENQTGYEYVSDEDKCIGCSFCADTCPCGIWQMNPI